VDRPSERGWALGMASLEGKLIPGKESKSAWFPEIQDDAYVVVEGYKHPGGGSTGLNLN
jgi:hypothetical protein